MSDEPDNLVLEMLRAIRAEQADFRSFMAGELSDMKLRLHSVEQHIVVLHSDIGVINARLARMDDRMDRLEKRLGLVDA